MALPQLCSFHHPCTLEPTPCLTVTYPLPLALRQAPGSLGYHAVDIRTYLLQSLHLSKQTGNPKLRGCFLLLISPIPTSNPLSLQE